jgi:hypothetical protein
MPWVMVPVPEELTERVETLLFSLKFRDKAPQWDETLMTDHLATLAGPQQDLLAAVAAGVRAGRPPEAAALTDQLQISEAELFRLVRECNQVTIGSAPGDLVHTRREPVPEPGEGERVVVYMVGELAELADDCMLALRMRAARG